MRNKYNAKKTKIDGITFDSRLEAQRYQQLKIFQDCRLISDLELQPVFELQPKFKKNGKTYRKIVYKADFKYFDNENGKVIVEDVKGQKTEVYKLKKKLFEYKYPELELTEVTKNDIRTR